MKFTRATSRTLPEFWTYYYKMNARMQATAYRKYLLFLESPDLVLFKKVADTEPPLYSARVSRSYRALGRVKNGLVYWEWIGPHDEYDELLKKLR